MQRILEKFDRTLLNEKERKAFYLKALVGILGCVALLMTIINMITETYPLGYITFCFTIFCIVDYALLLENEICRKVGIALFLAGIYGLLVYFIITGGTDNFSIQWVMIVPPLAVAFVGLVPGIALSALLLVTMLAFFNIPVLSAMITDYGRTFCLRFPIVYACVAIMSIFIEYAKHKAETEVQKAREQYQYLYVHDALTSLGNRYMMDEDIEALSDSEVPPAEAMFDIDFFKRFNDTYGHAFGDEVLKLLGQIVSENVPESASVYRWGGEEFFILFRDASVAQESCERVINAVRNYKFRFNNEPVTVTISIGLCISDEPASKTDFDQLLIDADDVLYEAKEAGRDTVKVKHIKEFERGTTMDLRTFYDKVGGSYDEVMGRLMKDDRALKYLARVSSDPNFDELLKNLDAQDYEAAFRSVHTLKGLALNLGLGKLATAASTLCEDLRNGPPTGDVAQERADVEAAYAESLAVIKELLNE